jgi:DNA mismatch repair ATPase MutL
MLWTNERLLSQIALSMSQNKDFEGMLPLGPSATIVLEFTQDSPTDDLNVKAFIND